MSNTNSKVKKEKIVMSITIGLSAFVLVAIAFMQFKVVNQTDITSIETLTETELRSELIAWREKYEELQLKYDETIKKMQEYQEEYKSDEKTQILLETELKSLQMLLGETNLTGEGITMTISEENIKEDRIYYEDLLNIVNSLKAAGAEAISINDNRIINRTDIVEVNGFIKVNSKNTKAPYTIKAIGNQTYLESALLGVGGYVDELKKWGFDVEIERNENVQIGAYTNELTFKYIN